MSVTPQTPTPSAPALAPLPPTPLAWRLAIGGGILALTVLAYVLANFLGPRGRAAIGIVRFLGLALAFSANLRAVNWRTVLWGVLLQVALALIVLRSQFGRNAFDRAGEVVKKFLDFSNEGAKFVFGNLANVEKMDEVFGKDRGFVFAFVALPTIVFVSSFFSVLYHYGILQLVVRGMAWVMRLLMRTSGAETLSVAANVFMGQTEAPLIVKPYVATMTRSELLTLMAGGMATISGSMMAVYIGMGADPVAILATSVMAAPCALYLSKIVLPETEVPRTAGETGDTTTPEENANVIDAAASGASDGMRLALNIAAMLIAFLAFIAMFNALLGLIDTVWLMERAWWPSAWTLPNRLSMEWILGRLFSPLAVLMGAEMSETGTVGSLLGIKLAANEFVAYAEFKSLVDRNALSKRSRVLATYALTGFANISSIGIQIGGIGALAPTRRGDLARLGPRALFTGFLVTLVNASIAGVLLEAE